VTVAGVPASVVTQRHLTASDDLGPMPLACTTTGSGVVTRPLWRRWTVGRPSVGQVEVRYLAPYRTVDTHTAAGHPPLDLRREGGGVTGTGVSFLALPPPSGRWQIGLRWQASGGSPLDGACSLGVGDVTADGTTEVLRDSHYMAGDLNSARTAGVTVWWLTPPSFDIRAFTARIAKHHEIIAGAFGGSAGELQVFLRSNPYPGLSASAFPSSFVVGWDHGSPDAATRLDHTLAHELVHGWVHLDGEPDETVWFNEGAADYFATVLPLRHGLLSRSAFLDRVNLAARLCYANPYRDLPLTATIPLAWTDFRAQQLPYGRGMFYLADLDARLAERAPAGSVQELVTRVISRQRSGQHVGLPEWADMVSATTGVDETPRIDAMVFQADGRPRADTWGPQFEYFVDDAPVIDPGFDPSTFTTRRITGLAPHGPAATAGLADGDLVLNLPSYEQLARRQPAQPFSITVQRDGQPLVVTVAAAPQRAKVPAWRPRPA
jgi:hypothetical protein